MKLSVGAVAGCCAHKQTKLFLTVPPAAVGVHWLRRPQYDIDLQKTQWTTCYMSSTTCTIVYIPQHREGAHHCRYHSKVQGTGPPAYMQHHVQWMHYCNTVQEHSPVVCFTESSGEQGRRLSRVELRVV